MGIQFEKLTESVEFHSPLKCMDLVEHVIERRRDPLSGRVAIGSLALAGKGEFFFGPTDRELIEKIAKDTRTNCLFCPEHVERATPRYRDNLFPGGALRRGECFLFPNLFPLSAIHAVVVLGAKHYRDLGDFPPDLLRDGLGAALDFIRTLFDNSPENEHVTVNANYLFPAGASMVHPHLQIFGGRYPASTVSELLQDCRRYREQNGRNYFDELVEQERQLGQRYIGALGPVQWLTPFAPVGTNEVLGILPDCPNLLQVDDLALDGLAEGISKVLAFYEQNGFSTFNFTLYSGRLGDDNSPLSIFVRILCRQNVRKYYRADDYFIQKLLGEELILTTPEDLAAGLRKFWK